MGGFFKVAGCASDFPRKVGFSNHGKRHLVWGYVARESKNFGLCGFVGVFSVQDGIGGMVFTFGRNRYDAFSAGIVVHD